MQKLILSLLALISFTTFCGVVLAAPACQTPPAMIDLDAKFSELSTTAKKRASDCYAARLLWAETRETDYTCPSGDYNADARPHTREILSYQIAVATVFAAIDEDAFRYSKSLQCMRERDVMKWDQTNSIVIHGDGNSVAWYEQKYQAVCQIWYIEKLLAMPEDRSKEFIQTTEAYPQWFDCSRLAKQKVQALDNLVALLAANGIGKWYENDKDKFITQVKGKYRTLIVKLVDYMKLVSTAVSKLDTYLTKTIR
jgi:hypothetical protein